MKRIYLLVVSAVILTCFTNFANAQFKYGGRAGLNLANMAGDFPDAEEPSMLLSFHVGIVGQYEFTEKLFVSPEINYSVKGFRQEFESRGTIVNVDTKTTVDFTRTLSYVEVPIHLGVKLSDSFVIKAGPYIGFLAGARLEGTSEVEVAGQTTKFDVDDSSTEGLSSTDFGLNLGAQVQLPNGFGVEARYGIGFSNTVDVGSEEAQNRVISFGITYLLGGE